MGENIFELNVAQISFLGIMRVYIEIGDRYRIVPYEIIKYLIHTGSI